MNAIRRNIVSKLEQLGYAVNVSRMVYVIARHEAGSIVQFKVTSANTRRFEVEVSGDEKSIEEVQGAFKVVQDYAVRSMMRFNKTTYDPIEVLKFVAEADQRHVFLKSLLNPGMEPPKFFDFTDEQYVYSSGVSHGHISRLFFRGFCVIDGRTVTLSQHIDDPSRDVYILCEVRRSALFSPEYIVTDGHKWAPAARTGDGTYHVYDYEKDKFLTKKDHELVGAALAHYRDSVDKDAN